MILLRTLGKVELSGAEPQVTGTRALALFVYLSVASKPVLRDELTTILWDPGTIRNERHSLSQILYSLRRSLPPAAITTSMHAVELSQPHTTDYREFAEAANNGRSLDAVRLYGGRFMSGLPYVSEAFDDWRTEIDAWIEARVLHCFRSLIEAAASKLAFDRVVQLCQEASRAFTFDDELVRHHVEALASLGDVGAALAVYSAHRHRSIKEFGSPPSWMTDEFVARISRLPQIASPDGRSDVQLPLVGRERDVARLRHGWTSSQDMAIVFQLIGEPGIGKTRLLKHAARRAVLDGARVFLHRGAAAETALPFSAIVGLIASSHKPDDGAGLAAQWQETLSWLAPELFPTAVRHATPPQRVLFQSVAQYFAHVGASKPLVLIIDDWQWVDDASRQILQYVLRRLEDRCCMLLLASRQNMDAMVDGVRSERITLGSLAADAVEELIGAFEATTQVPLTAAYRDRLHTQTAGNPLFITELLRAYLDRPDDRAATERAVPASISGLLAEKFKALTPEGRVVASTIAVFNRAADFRAVCEVSGISQLTAAEALDELVRTGIVTGDGVYGFVHDLMRDAAYNATGATLRRTLHFRAVEQLSDSAASIGEVAFHCEHAGLTARALTAARQAAREAEAVYAFKTADEQFQRMLRCSTGDTYDSTVAEYVKFLFRTGRLRNAGEYVARALQYSERSHDESLELICQLIEYEIAGESHASHADIVQQCKWLLNRAQRACPQIVPRIIQSLGDLVRCSDRAELVEPMVEFLASEGDVSRLAVAALLAGTTKGPEFAQCFAEEASRRARLAKNPILLIDAAFAVGTVRLWAGDCSAAKRAYNEVLGLIKDTGVSNRLASTLSNLAIVAMEAGEYKQADDLVRESLRESLPAQVPYCLANLALLRYRQGDLQGVVKYTDMLEECSGRRLHDWVDAQLLAFRGLAALESGDLTCVALSAQQLASLVPRDSDAIDSSVVHEFRARVLANSKGPQAAAVYLNDRSGATMHLDFLPAARLMILAAKYALEYDKKLARQLAGPVRARAIAGGANMLADLAASVLSEAGE